MGCNTSSEEWPHVSVFIGFDNCYQFHLAWGPRELQLLQRSRFTSNFLSLPSLLPMPRVGTVNDTEVEGNNVAGIWKKVLTHVLEGILTSNNLCLSKSAAFEVTYIILNWQN